MVDKAKEGLYSQFEIQRGLPIQMLIKYFTQLPTTAWQINTVSALWATYRMQNLLESFSALGRFDIIFCRNVLIYFDEATRAQVTEKFGKNGPRWVFILGQYGNHCG